MMTSGGEGQQKCVRVSEWKKSGMNNFTRWFIATDTAASW